MKEKQFDPAGQNEKAPAPGMAAVDTHNPEEVTSKEEKHLKPEDDSREQVNNTNNDRQ